MRSTRRTDWDSHATETDKWNVERPGSAAPYDSDQISFKPPYRRAFYILQYLSLFETIGWRISHATTQDSRSKHLAHLPLLRSFGHDLLLFLAHLSHKWEEQGRMKESQKHNREKNHSPV